MIHISEKRLFDYMDGNLFTKSEEEHFKYCECCQKNYKMNLGFNQGLTNYISNIDLSVDLSGAIMERIEHEKKDFFEIILHVSSFLLIIASIYFLYHFSYVFNIPLVNTYMDSIREFVSSQFYLFQAITIVSLLLVLEKFIQNRKRLNIKILSHSLVV